jgi:adenosylhomocysteine nucleosidase
MVSELRVVVAISANAEWRVVRERLAPLPMQATPYGEWCAADLPVGDATVPVAFVHGGWGKIAAAASTQYAIDRWHPALFVNLGTCGGFAGAIDRGAVVLVDRTIVYDIIEQMSDQPTAIAHYTTEIDLDWLDGELPHAVRRGLLVSGDRDLVAAEIPMLRERYGAVAGDWESGAIAFVCARNGTRCLILRGVSDLVSEAGGEAYGDYALFAQGTARVMGHLLDMLPAWLALALLDRER